MLCYSLFNTNKYSKNGTKKLFIKIIPPSTVLDTHLFVEDVVFTKILDTVSLTGINACIFLVSFITFDLLNRFIKRSLDCSRSFWST